MVELRKAVVEEFKEQACELQGACVVDWMRRELESAFDPHWWEGGELDEASKELRKAFVTTLNFIADVTDNEDLRVEEEKKMVQEVKLELTFNIYNEELEASEVPGIIEEAVEKAGYTLQDRPEIVGITVRTEE